jgi:hypothetical protein
MRDSSSNDGAKNECDRKRCPNHGAYEAGPMGWADFHQADLRETVKTRCTHALEGSTDDPAHKSVSIRSSPPGEKSIQRYHVLRRSAAQGESDEHDPGDHEHISTSIDVAQLGEAYSKTFDPLVASQAAMMFETLTHVSQEICQDNPRSVNKVV